MEAKEQTWQKERESLVKDSFATLQAKFYEVQAENMELRALRVKEQPQPETKGRPFPPPPNFISASMAEAEAKKQLFPPPPNFISASMAEAEARKKQFPPPPNFVSASMAKEAGMDTGDTAAASASAPGGMGDVNTAMAILAARNRSIESKKSPGAAAVGSQDQPKSMGFVPPPMPNFISASMAKEAEMAKGTSFPPPPNFISASMAEAEAKKQLFPPPPNFISASMAEEEARKNFPPPPNFISASMAKEAGMDTSTAVAAPGGMGDVDTAMAILAARNRSIASKKSPLPLAAGAPDQPKSRGFVPPPMPNFISASMAAQADEQKRTSFPPPPNFISASMTEAEAKKRLFPPPSNFISASMAEAEATRKAFPPPPNFISASMAKGAGEASGAPTGMSVPGDPGDVNTAMAILAARNRSNGGKAGSTADLEARFHQVVSEMQELKIALDMERKQWQQERESLVRNSFANLQSKFHEVKAENQELRTLLEYQQQEVVEEVEIEGRSFFPPPPNFISASMVQKAQAQQGRNFPPPPNFISASMAEEEARKKNFPPPPNFISASMAKEAGMDTSTAVAAPGGMGDVNTAMAILAARNRSIASKKSPSPLAAGLQDQPKSKGFVPPPMPNFISASMAKHADEQKRTSFPPPPNFISASMAQKKQISFPPPPNFISASMAEAEAKSNAFPPPPNVISASMEKDAGMMTSGARSSSVSGDAGDVNTAMAILAARNAGTTNRTVPVGDLEAKYQQLSIASKKSPGAFAAGSPDQPRSRGFVPPPMPNFISASMAKEADKQKRTSFPPPPNFISASMAEAEAEKQLFPPPPNFISASMAEEEARKKNFPPPPNFISASMAKEAGMDTSTAVAAPGGMGDVNTAMAILAARNAGNTNRNVPVGDLEAKYQQLLAEKEELRASLKTKEQDWQRERENLVKNSVACLEARFQDIKQEKEELETLLSAERTLWKKERETLVQMTHDPLPASFCSASIAQKAQAQQGRTFPPPPNFISASMAESESKKQLFPPPPNFISASMAAEEARKKQFPPPPNFISASMAKEAAMDTTAVAASGHSGDINTAMAILAARNRSIASKKSPVPVAAGSQDMSKGFVPPPMPNFISASMAKEAEARRSFPSTTKLHQCQHGRSRGQEAAVPTTTQLHQCQHGRSRGQKLTTTTQLHSASMAEAEARKKNFPPPPNFISASMAKEAAKAQGIFATSYAQLHQCKLAKEADEQKRSCFPPPPNFISASMAEAEAKKQLFPPPPNFISASMAKEAGMELGGSSRVSVVGDVGDVNTAMAILAARNRETSGKTSVTKHLEARYHEMVAEMRQLKGALEMERVQWQQEREALVRNSFGKLQSKFHEVNAENEALRALLENQQQEVVEEVDIAGRSFFPPPPNFISASMVQKAQTQQGRNFPPPPNFISASMAEEEARKKNFPPPPNFISASMAKEAGMDTSTAIATPGGIGDVNTAMAILAARNRSIASKKSPGAFAAGSPDQPKSRGFWPPPMPTSSVQAWPKKQMSKEN
ncbi:expressed unknown protein [Seminavis robusta]|uniref:Uncharacterized protein n=1 Tax=Seminavis robusta TaxID=568900 RepID=A0A9N8DSH2_9STRA|nr:expressed unknown protein [Seminavis robusta]|eukprot:Sro247_g098180.1 n/a (1523) ;mRNA; f:65894-70676